MTFKAELASPDARGFGGWAEDVLRDLKKAVSGAVGIAANGLKEDLRREIAAAGLGNKLPNAVRSKVYPSGNRGSLHAAGFIYPSGKGAQNILDAFSQGVTIRSADGFFLAIPTEAAGTHALGKRITPELWERATGLRLRLVLHGRNGLLVAEQKRSRNFRAGKRARRADTLGRGDTHSAIIFILVRQVRLNRRLQPDQIAQAWADRVPGLIARATPSV
jgi:hypothetical protein